MAAGVAPDGSPVAVYLALPPGDVPELVAGQTPPGGSILELGSGPGRITRPLAARGFRVVAVDESPEMLAHVDVAETVLGDVYGLDLRRRFDTVLGASHLISVRDPARRAALLDVCRRHVAATGRVLLQRYEPAWAQGPVAMSRDAGPVSLAFEPLEVGEGWFGGRMTYELAGERWVQEFTGAHVAEATLAAEAQAAGLRLEGWLDDARTWARLVPQSSSAS